MLGNDSIAYLGRYCEPVLWPSCLCWGGVIESGDLFVYAVRDCGGGSVGQLRFWRGLMTLRGEAVAAEVVSMGRLYWTLGLGKTRGKIGADMQRLGNFEGLRGGGTLRLSCGRGGRGRAAVTAEWPRHFLVLVRLESCGRARVLHL